MAATPTSFNNTTTNLESMPQTTTEQIETTTTIKTEFNVNETMNAETMVTQIHDEATTLKTEIPFNSTFITQQNIALIKNPDEEGLDEITLGEIEEKVKQFIMATQRKPLYHREIIPIQGPPGKIRRVVRRLQTPVPDTIERVHVIKPQRDYVDVLIEKPATPPPVYVEKNLVEKPEKPVVTHRVIQVPSRKFSPQVSRVPLYHQQSFQSFAPSFAAYNSQYQSIVPHYHY